MNGRENIDLERIYSEINQECKTISDIVGMENMVKIMRKLGGNYMYIPKLDSYIVPDRNKGLVEAYQSGKTLKQLAYEYSLCEASVRAILCRAGVSLRPQKKRNKNV